MLFILPENTRNRNRNKIIILASCAHLKRNTIYNKKRNFLNYFCTVLENKVEYAPLPLQVSERKVFDKDEELNNFSLSAEVICNEFGAETKLLLL